MKISTYFSKQARRPNGVFGRIVMRLVFDKGNAFLNNFVSEIMSVRSDERIIEIGSGTGKLIYQMAQTIDSGLIEGIDFSSAMVSIARKRNRNNIAKGRVKIVEGDFDGIPFEKEQYSKAYSVNTLYFWPSPEHTLKKIADILKPDGKLFLAFEDIEQLKKRKLDQSVFNIYTENEVENLIISAGFSNNVNLVSRDKGNLKFHCIVAKK